MLQPLAPGLRGLAPLPGTLSAPTPKWSGAVAVAGNQFSGTVIASTLPRPDCGYDAEEHGMVYPYRLLPAEYTAKE